MKRKLITMPAVAFVFALILSGCASTAHIEKDDTADFSSYKTFGWLETRKDRKNDLAEKKITSAVTAELEKAGWKENDRNPDIYLNYDIDVERSTKETSDPVYSGSFVRYLYNPYTRRIIPVYYPSRLLGFDRREQSVREGTVTVSMIDARTNKVVWQGWSTGEVNSKNLTSREIQNAVKNIFKRSDLAKN